MFIDVTGVEALRSHSIGTAELVLGGNVSLTEAMEILTNASKNHGFEYCKHLVHHIDLIANVPVRNVSCEVNWNVQNLKQNSIVVGNNCGKFEYQTWEY